MREIGTIERTNGTSWFGVDDRTVWTTKHLRIEDGDEVVYEKSYGHVAREHVTCVADHVVPEEDHATTWTVQLVRTR